MVKRGFDLRSASPLFLEHERTGPDPILCSSADCGADTVVPVDTRTPLVKAGYLRLLLSSPLLGDFEFTSSVRNHVPSTVNIGRDEQKSAFHRIRSINDNGERSVVSAYGQDVPVATPANSAIMTMSCKFSGGTTGVSSNRVTLSPTVHGVDTDLQIHETRNLIRAGPPPP